jgi:hypothetical protein
MYNDIATLIQQQMQGAATDAPASEPSQDEQIQALIAALASPEERGAIENQIQQAQALRRQQGPQYTNPRAAFLGGLNDIVRQVGGALLEKEARGKQVEQGQKLAQARQAFAKQVQGGAIPDIGALFGTDEAVKQNATAALHEAIRKNRGTQAQAMLVDDPVIRGFAGSLDKDTDQYMQLLAQAGQGGLKRTTEAAKRQQELEDLARSEKFRETESAKNRAAQIDAARVSAGLSRGKEDRAAERGTTVPGAKKLEGAEPTADDAKKVKASIAAAERMGKYVSELRQLHKDYGTELTGSAATRMGQLSTAIQLEGKNIAELGALSGPDLGLMQALSGADPSSLGANAKSMVGIDNTQTALEGLDKWVGDTLSANMKTYGYEKSSGQDSGGAGLTQQQRSRLEELRKKRAAGMLK